jgi:hypothetical protein
VVECKIQELQGSILRQEGSSPNWDYLLYIQENVGIAS